MVSPDSRLGTVGIYIQYITKIVVLVSEPVRGRSRATELPCFIKQNPLLGGPWEAYVEFREIIFFGVLGGPYVEPR